jgi:hypothetical protein
LKKKNNLAFAELPVLTFVKTLAKALHISEMYEISTKTSGSRWNVKPFMNGCHTGNVGYRIFPMAKANYKVS